MSCFKRKLKFEQSQADNRHLFGPEVAFNMRCFFADRDQQAVVRFILACLQMNEAERHDDLAGSAPVSLALGKMPVDEGTSMWPLHDTLLCLKSAFSGGWLFPVQTNAWPYWPTISN